MDVMEVAIALLVFQIGHISKIKQVADLKIFNKVARTNKSKSLV